MNREIRDRWIAALRSGKYQQGKYSLRRDERYCCLGVLCELAVQDGIIERYDPLNDHVYDFGDENGSSNGALPPTVVRWAGLHDSIPLVRFAGNEHGLASLNDSIGLNFNQIAQIIEQQL